MKIENLTIGDMAGYVQCADASRWSLDEVAKGWMTSTVMAGDRWQPGGDTSDDRKFSERTEFRSLEEDAVGDGRAYVYAFYLNIPSDFPEMSPKQTLAQWHEGDYPVAFLRYENKKLEFVLNYQSGLNFRRQISVRKGVPLKLEFAFVWTPRPNAGRVIVIADDKVIVDEKDVSIVESSAKAIYAKFGIYRSGMNAYTGPKPAPSQTVFHARLSRSVCAVADLPARFTGVSASTPVPAPAPLPAPTTPAPTPAPAVDTVASRIARIQTELGVLARDVGVPSAATLLTQAAEKMAKASAQISKAGRAASS